MMPCGVNNRKYVEITLPVIYLPVFVIRINFCHFYFRFIVFVDQISVNHQNRPFVFVEGLVFVFYWDDVGLQVIFKLWVKIITRSRIIIVYL